MKYFTNSKSYDAMQCDYCGDYYDPRDMTEYNYDGCKWYSCPNCESEKHGRIESDTY